MSTLTVRNDQICDSKGMKMARDSSKYFSIRLTQILMKIIGFWTVQTRKDRLILRATYLYMLLVLFVSLTIELLDLYHCRNDFYAATYTACSTIPLFIILMKTVVFTVRRKEILWLIEYAQTHFWHDKYNSFGKKTMDNLDKRAILFMSSFTILIYATVIIYSLSPILENMGKSSEERVLPFPFRWFDLPTSKTPYYEILFVIETLSAVHSGVCFCCFDNFLCILSMHVGGQFKILQNKLQTIMPNESSKDKSAGIYNEFKHCLEYHHALLSYVEKLEYVFCIPLMIQLLVSSVVLCVSGFQLCLVDGVFMKRLLFLMYFLGGLIQIFLITLNCNEIMEQSSAIGNAIYNSDWERKPYGNFYQIRKDMIIVMARAKRPCYITAGKFFPISLESFTKVLSMTASYYTLLCTMEMDVVEQ